MNNSDDKLELSTSQQFLQEKFLRTIESEEDIEKLRSLCKTLLTSWFSQKAATAWALKQNLPTFKPIVDGYSTDH